MSPALGTLSQLDHQLATLLLERAAHDGRLAYLLLFALVLGEIGVAPLFFLPGDPLLFLCGALAAAGVFEVALLLPLFFVASLAGHGLAYAIGRRLGARAWARNARWLDRELLRRAERFFAGHGGLGLLVTPYVAVLRTFAPLAAGVAGMAPGRFLLASAVGSALWSGGLLALGYFFGHVPLVREHMGSLVLLGLALGLGGLVLKRLRRG